MLDDGGGGLGAEADLPGLGAVGVVALLGCDVYGEGGVAAADDEVCGFAVGVLEVGDEGGKGAWVEGVDGLDAVSGLEAGAGGRHVGLVRDAEDGGGASAA